jgi:aspartyl-tRNA(Asn)/glutamyl-tRNA(Gln) amidotransferase subunit C
MATIKKKEVEHVAKLAKLHFEEEELDGFTSQFEKILEMIAQLDEVDTTGVAFTMNVADNDSRMREDVAVPGWDREALLKNVPTKEAGFIQVPAMLADGGDA